MGWGFLSPAIATALIAWLAVLTLIVAWKGIRSARQSLDLMRDAHTRTVTPERIQALIFGTLLIGGYMIAGVLALANPSGPSMPELPEWLVSILAGSQTLYLSGKIARREIHRGRRS